MTLIETAISGAHHLPSPTTPEATLEEFYAAFNGRDIALMTQNWSDGAEANMSNPLGGIRRGWEDIQAGYHRLFTGPAQVYVEFYDYSVHVAGDLFYAVGRERGDFRLGETLVELAIRTSRIYRRHPDRWRQVHHHGSIDDPVLLDRYQAAVLHANP
jgi:ketosteroid isomerase-like protein